MGLGSRLSALPVLILTRLVCDMLQLLSPAGYQWNITFPCAQSAVFPLLQPVNLNLTTAVNVTEMVLTASRIPASAPVSGSFQLTFRNETTPPIPYNATASQLSSILTSLASIDTVRAVQSGNPLLGSTWVVTFLGPSGNQSLMTASTGLLNGTNVNLMVSKVQNGSLDVFLDPIPGSLLQVS